MIRTHTSAGIVLKTNPIGELHKGVTILAPEIGLVRAIAHGARSARGKLRGSTNPFVYGEFFLYTDPVRESTKITDVNVIDHFSGIREELAKFFTASLWSELILRTHAGGGESASSFELLLASLQLLDGAAAGSSDYVLVQFLWRFLKILGSQPDLGSCAASGEYLAEGEPIYYSIVDHGFCSPAFGTDDMVVWEPGAAAYVRHTAKLDVVDAVRVRPPDGALIRIKRVLYRIMQDLVEEPLNTLRTGAGIL